MKWEKLGRLYKPEVRHPKLLTHAANPLAMLIENDLYRVYYSGRDINNRSSVGYIDIDLHSREVVYVHNKPVFSHGDKDTFYSHGVSIGNSYESNGTKYILFMGWQCQPGEHWMGEIGRLKVNKDMSLSLDLEKAYITTDDTDPVSLSYPWVLKELDGSYVMWYGSTRTWDAGNGEMLHVINKAISRDGHSWKKCGLELPFSIDVAQAFSRPTVVGNANDGYRMWFSYRSGMGDKYKIGYASNNNKNEWILDLNNSGITCSKDGWDSEMIEYPFVFKHKEKLYMLYNGNEYGKTGIGLAVLIDE